MTKELNKILVVEDSAAIRHLLTAHIEIHPNTKVLGAETLASAQKILNIKHKEISLAVLDLNLPDAPKGEIVDLVQKYNIPVIVLTGTLSEHLQETILKKNVIDYVVKRNSSEIEYVATLVNRILCNRQVTAMVVDDSASFRAYMSELLFFHGYRVKQASGGTEALSILKQYPEIRLIITDYNMPDMNGLELIYQLRANRPRSELGVIGVTGSDDTTISSQLLKAGANDILKKPFETEEFYCRVNQLMDNLDHIQKIRETASRDFLTKLYNRAYLFESGTRLLRNAERGHLKLTVAMIDIDYFKSVNDNHGHDFGDIALKIVASTIQKSVRDTDLVVRFGGEEFCVLAVNADNPELLFERIRKNVENAVISDGHTTIHSTISIGITLQLEKELDKMISTADKALYQAKNNGRNRFEFAETRESLQE